MLQGRPPMGSSLVDKLDGTEEAKCRLKVVLETISGTRNIPEACEALGLGESAFYKLRDQVLTAAMERLLPRPAGRPRLERSEEDERVAALEKEIQELRVNLRASQIREEIALVMPHLLKRRLDAA
jgi:hypothetical protein